MTLPAVRLSSALCILGAAALLVGAGALLLESARDVALNTVSSEAAAIEPAARSGSKWRCAHCGRIATRRELRADGDDDPALRIEYTVRMADGSTRTFQEPAAVMWRLGEPLMIID